MLNLVVRIRRHFAETLVVKASKQHSHDHCPVEFRHCTPRALDVQLSSNFLKSSVLLDCSDTVSVERRDLTAAIAMLPLVGSMIFNHKVLSRPTVLCWIPTVRDRSPGFLLLIYHWGPGVNTY